MKDDNNELSNMAIKESRKTGEPRFFNHDGHTYVAVNGKAAMYYGPQTIQHLKEKTGKA